MRSIALNSPEVRQRILKRREENKRPYHARSVQVTDAVYLLNFSFLQGVEPLCLAACDANGDGRLRGEVTDAVYLLNFSFLSGPAPPAPFPACGPGTDNALDCGTGLETCN